MLKHRVSNRATVPKRAHAAHTGLQLTQCTDVRTQGAPCAHHCAAQMRVEHTQLCIRHGRARRQPNHELEQPCHSSSWLGVPNVGLHAPDGQRREISVARPQQRPCE